MRVYRASVTWPGTLGAVRRISTDRLVWAVTVFAVALFWLVSTSFRPWDLFARAGFSSDFYDEQARVFLRGRLAVDPAVPGPEGFLIGERTYLYYGPFLALVRLPFAALNLVFDGVFVGRLVRISMLIALAVLCRWSARLARAGRRLVRSSDDVSADDSDDDDPDGSPDDDGRWGIVGFTAAVACSPALFAAGWISVYNETELWALTLAVITITLLVEWAAGGFVDARRLAWASVAALAATLTRAPIGFGVAFAVGVCGVVLVLRHRRFDGPARLAVAGGLVPVVVHAIVNRAKFGTWLSVPGDRQLLSLQNPVRAEFFERTNGSFFSADFLPTTLLQYWRPDAIRFERLVPGVRFGPLADDIGATAVESVTPASSLPTSALLLLLLAIVGVVWIIRYRSLTWALVVGATALGALPTFGIGFIANRYLIDMLPPLITAGAVGVWWVAERATDRRAVTFGFAVLALFGFWVNSSLAIWNLELKSPGFTELRYAVDGAIFGDGRPSVTDVEPGDPAPRDGVVGVLGDCSGVYIAEQGAWVALERSPGQRSISGELSTAADQVLASTDLWSLTAAPTGSGSVLVTLERSDGVEGFVSEVMVTDDLAPFEVVADPVTGVFVAEIGDEGFFLPGDVLTDGGPDLRPDKTSEVAPSSLCRDLTS